MTITKTSLAILIAVLFAPLSASALGIQIVNTTYTDGPNMRENQIVTFDLLLQNPGNIPVHGLDIGVFGYDEGALGDDTDNHLRFEGASSGAGAFGVAFAPGANLGGLAASVPQQEIGNPIIFQERFVRLFGGVAVTPVIGDGNSDSGVNDLQTGPGGDYHLQVTFRSRELDVEQTGTVTIDLVFGIGQQGFGVVGPDGLGGSHSLASQWSNAVATVTIVPEPGTALLIGLGLVGLSGMRRR